MIDKLTGEGGEDEEVKKIINIFNFKQRLLSIDIKTKVVQHVPRIIFKVFRFPAPVGLSDIFCMC